MNTFNRASTQHPLKFVHFTLTQKLTLTMSAPAPGIIQMDPYFKDKGYQCNLPDRDTFRECGALRYQRSYDQETRTLRCSLDVDINSPTDTPREVIDRAFAALKREGFFKFWEFHRLVITDDQGARHKQFLL